MPLLEGGQADTGGRPPTHIFVVKNGRLNRFIEVICCALSSSDFTKLTCIYTDQVTCECSMGQNT